MLAARLAFFASWREELIKLYRVMHHAAAFARRLLSMVAILAQKKGNLAEAHRSLKAARRIPAQRTGFSMVKYSFGVNYFLKGADIVFGTAKAGYPQTLPITGVESNSGYFLKSIFFYGPVSPFQGRNRPTMTSKGYGGNASDMKNTITPTEEKRCCKNGCQSKEPYGHPLERWDKHNDGRVYLLNTKQLRISSTKKWAKTLDQLRQQIKKGCSIDGGGLKDHFC